MRKLLLLAVILLSFAPLCGQNTCEITITGDFDSECIYDYKDEITDEYPHLMVACRNSTVTYTAHADVGTATVSGYTWEIYGDVSHTATGDHVTVTWGGDEWALVTVTVATSTGRTCTESVRVKLIAPPTAACATVPAYTFDGSRHKVVYVCKGSSVQFIDQSSSSGSDIAGYHWESTQANPSSSPNYLIENVSMDDKVIHRVFNNCGCYDVDTIWIEMREGEPLELDCYGTVCENATVEYQAVNPLCYDYHWYVEGGTLVDGQGSSYPKVQWDHPQNGYGVLGLDGNLCGYDACPTMMSVKVPVIQGGLDIDGQTDVCVGEAVLVRLPLFGSTRYDWSISPATGVNTLMMTHSNETRLVFGQAGTYTLQCSYRCDFLDCGPLDATPLTIKVKPKLEIVGDDQICIANPCSLATLPAVNADWQAYDLGNGNQPVGNPVTGSPSYTATFSQPGRYLVTAEHPAYCGPATFLLIVKDVPPAPTVAEMMPDNRHTCCPYQTAVLRGSPSNPHYSLVWAPACSTATPPLYSGDSVAVGYQGQVCDVRVYHYDMLLQCQSTGYYVHQMSALTLDPTTLPTSITVCPNSYVSLTGKVLDQRSEGVLYEWKIQPTMQYCASVQGSHLLPDVTLSVNDISTPTTFYVELTRTYCDASTDVKRVTVNVVDYSNNSLLIYGPDNVCVHDQETYTGSGGSASTYRWSMDGGQWQGNPVTVSFDRAGYAYLTLRSNPYDYCTNIDMLPRAVKQVHVFPGPPVVGLRKKLVGNQQTVEVYPTPAGSGYSYAWQYMANGTSTFVPVTGNSYSIPYLGMGIYQCIVSDGGCNVTLTWDSSIEDPQPCDSMVVSGSYDPCAKTITFTVPSNEPNILWDVRRNGIGLSPQTSSPNNHTATLTVGDAGLYYAEATADITGCRKGRKTLMVDVVPDITIEQVCDKVVLRNHSQYIDGSTVLYFSVSNDCNNTVDYFQMTASTTSYEHTPASPNPLLPCTYTFTLTGIGANGNITPCVIGSQTMFMPPQYAYVDITSANAAYNHNACDNTPIELSAVLHPTGQIVSSVWSFGDNSGFETDGGQICHTFEVSNMSYTVSVAIIDEYGCQRNAIAPITVTSHADNLYGGALNYTFPKICPNTNDPKNIFFTLPIQSNIYTWTDPHTTNTYPSTTNNTHPTYYPGDYRVYVKSAYYCQKEATRNVEFLKSPIADIYAESFSCCVGDEVNLYGKQGPSSDQLTYDWTITSAGGFYQTYNTANIVFTAPAAGTYSVTLTVTNNSSTCSSTDTKTLTVTTPPTAPTISMTGSPCISDAPVQLTASGYTGTMHWSNGQTGTDAYYFTHGLASAYYYDPSIGCPSEKGKHRIDKQPDFDALLTGCYWKCKEYFGNILPVYGITDDWQTIYWDWLLDDNSFATGSGNYTYLPIQLPLPGFGTYQLSVDYEGGACNEISPKLVIDEKKLCDCDSVSVSYERRMFVDGECRVVYDVSVTVCNHSKVYDFCPGALVQMLQLQGGAVVSSNFVPTTISPNGCYTFSLQINVPTFEPSVVCCKLVDSICMHCEKEFCIDLIPDKITCEDTMYMEDLYGISGLSSLVAGYFSFTVDVSPADEVLAFWSEPPMVINYMYDGTAHVTGLGMIDASVLSQLMMENGMVCFHAITCEDGELCKRTVCFPSGDFYGMIPLGKTASDSTMDKTLVRNHGIGAKAESRDLRLVPNPTTGEVAIEMSNPLSGVTVVGTADEVTEVVVMDMHGRRLATFKDAGQFNIKELPSGSYIVCVKTRRDKEAPEEVNYLKLVKK